MAYRYWQAGLHIQRDAMVCVALQQGRSGWGLRRWWWQQNAPDATDVQRIVTLRQWRREMPLQHRVAVAFPAAGTIKRTLPAPGLTLRDSEQAQWITSSMAQQLEMPAGALACDYHDVAQRGLRVTAARQQEVVRLYRLARDAGLRVGSVTPDASALQHYFPWLTDSAAGLSWFDGEQWLWATREDWGCGAEPAPDAIRCCSDADGFDPWRCLSQLQPPLPEAGDRFTIALALALAGRCRVQAG
ncbi:hypothetical protein [Pluralibacter gergoviae]|mgnify:FL=1|uniref:hypothetical protein n=1 Tax=Pluralibacter gergoviae TaxID=61647 RepID=UPI000651EA8E|nr:hypothetical protein [Pluralibacter gergoviae]EKV6245361.1 pilus assembly protein [Pluralibacter gergoviae]EKW9967098.1 pilus assembly protein [Pluralibacter gergoviae]ELD4302899.1 pilus assembly protein [Pluralibacter gergoviae]ELN2736891.1 pilus assembly protein [Pluralibacter gergoviae]KMK30818.1 hypothetical protein ABW12_20500 [Pluralibacter gergoviae]